MVILNAKYQHVQKLKEKNNNITKSVGFWVSHTAVIHLRVYCAIYTFIAVVL